MVTKKKGRPKKAAAKKVVKKKGRPKKAVKVTKKKVVKRKLLKSKLSTLENIDDFSESVIKPQVVIRVRKRTPARKINLVLANLLFFVMLFVSSALLFLVAGTTFYKSLFFLLGLIFGGLSVAFLMVLLIFVIARLIR